MGLVILGKTFSMTQKWAGKGVHAMTSTAFFASELTKSEEDFETAWTPILHSALLFLGTCSLPTGKALHTSQLPKPRLHLAVSPWNPSVLTRCHDQPLPGKEAKGREMVTARVWILDLQDLLVRIQESYQLCAQPCWPRDAGMNILLEPLGSSYSHRSLWWWRVAGCSGNAKMQAPT